MESAAVIGKYSQLYGGSEGTCEGGTIDILSETHLVIVTPLRHWKQGVQRLIVCQVHLPDRKPVLVLHGERSDKIKLETIEMVCARQNFELVIDPSDAPKPGDQPPEGSTPVDEKIQEICDSRIIDMSDDIEPDAVVGEKELAELKSALKVRINRFGKFINEARLLEPTAISDLIVEFERLNEGFERVSKICEESNEYNRVVAIFSRERLVFNPDASVKSLALQAELSRWCTQKGLKGFRKYWTTLTDVLQSAKVNRYSDRKKGTYWMGVRLAESNEKGKA